MEQVKPSLWKPVLLAPQDVSAMNYEHISELNRCRAKTLPSFSDSVGFPGREWEEY